MPVRTHLSRSELTSLLFDKLHVIVGECEEVDKEHYKASNAQLADTKARLKRIAVEARRAASLIETHERVAKAGHCLHCGKKYEEHLVAPESLPPGAPRVRLKGEEDPPPMCRALQQFFESAEIETYQPLELQEPW
jgi:hypothetical protein